MWFQHLHITCAFLLLPAFPLPTALPWSLVGHYSDEYYAGSVTLALARLRPSHVPSRRNETAHRRLPTHALKCTHCASPIRQGVVRAKLEHVPADSVGVQTCYRRACRFRRWALGFAQSSSSHSAQALQGHSIHVFCCPLLYRHAIFPSSFRI